MKLKDLAKVVYSTHSRIQKVTLWSATTGEDIIFECPIEYAVKHFSGFWVCRVYAEDSTLILEVED